MEKHFRDQDGNEITAKNEIQARAFENQGFQAGKASKAKAQDMEFSQELNVMGQATKQAQQELQKQASQLTQESGTTQNANMEFGQEADMKAIQEAHQTANKTNKKSN